MNKKILSVVIIVILIVLGVIFSQKTKTIPNKPVTESGAVLNKPISIQANIASSTAEGQAALNGARLAADEINTNQGVGGRPVVIIISDTGSTQPISFSLNDGINLTIYPTTETAYSLAPNLKLKDESHTAEIRKPDSFFASTYREVYKTSPTFDASTAYDAVYILARALAEHPADLNRFMHATNFKTATYGNITFDDQGRISTPENYFVTKKGK